MMCSVTKLMANDTSQIFRYIFFNTFYFSQLEEPGKEMLLCTYCGKQTHLRDDCQRLKRYYNFIDRKEIILCTLFCDIITHVVIFFVSGKLRNLLRGMKYCFCVHFVAAKDIQRTIAVKRRSESKQITYIHVCVYDFSFV